MDDPTIFCIYPSFLNNTKIKNFLILTIKKIILYLAFFIFLQKTKSFHKHKLKKKNLLIMKHTQWDTLYFTDI